MSGPIAWRTAWTRLDVGRRIAPDFDLDRGESRLDELASAGLCSRGLVCSHAIAAADRKRTPGAAQQFEDRLALGAAANVPACHFERALGKPIVNAGEIHPAVDFFDVGGIATDDLRREHAVDQGPRAPHGFAAPARNDRGLAGPFNARVGQHPHQHVLGNRVLPQRADHPPLGFDGNANGIGFNVRDFHSRVG